jgi:hypothetical protein
LHVLYDRHQTEHLKHTLASGEQQPFAKVEQLKDDLKRVAAKLDQCRATGMDQNRDIERYYDDFYAQSFQWLISNQPDVRALVADVTDTLRVLRCADALRQRGTLLKTSGGYEVFIDQNSGNAIYALRSAEDELYLLELADPISAGEANIASSELDCDGNLRISFQRGQFARPEATRRAASASALVANDIQLDVIDSFCRSEAGADPSAREMQLLLEETDDNLDFVGLV